MSLCMWAYFAVACCEYISAVLNICLESALPEDPVHCCTFEERKNKLPIKLPIFVTELESNFPTGISCVMCVIAEFLFYKPLKASALLPSCL